MVFEWLLCWDNQKMTDEFTKSLGIRLKELRKQRSFTQEKFAELLEVDPKHLSRIECGKTQPSLNLLKNAAVIFNIKINDFFIEEKTYYKENMIKNIMDILKKSNETELKLFYKIISVIKN